MGILKDEKEQRLLAGKDVGESNRSVFTVYAEDMEQKLAVFEKTAETLNTLLTQINGLFRYKKLKLDGERGLIFESVTGQELPVTALSSGEQHQLVLVFALLFKTKPDTLVLIDEPELSLHVAWQVTFIRDMLKIISLAQFDLILATHSPQIVNDRWDLTVELKGPANA